MNHLLQQNKEEEDNNNKSDFKGKLDPDFMKLKEFKLKQARGMAKFKLSSKHVCYCWKLELLTFF